MLAPLRVSRSRFLNLDSAEALHPSDLLGLGLDTQIRVDHSDAACVWGSGGVGGSSDEFLFAEDWGVLVFLDFSFHPLPKGGGWLDFYIPICPFHLFQRPVWSCEVQKSIFAEIQTPSFYREQHIQLIWLLQGFIDSFRCGLPKPLQLPYPTRSPRGMRCLVWCFSLVSSVEDWLFLLQARLKGGVWLLFVASLFC